MDEDTADVNEKIKNSLRDPHIKANQFDASIRTMTQYLEKLIEKKYIQTNKTSFNNSDVMIQDILSPENISHNTLHLLQ